MQGGEQGVKLFVLSEHSLSEYVWVIQTLARRGLSVCCWALLLIIGFCLLLVGWVVPSHGAVDLRGPPNNVQQATARSPVICKSRVAGCLPSAGVSEALSEFPGGKWVLPACFASCFQCGVVLASKVLVLLRSDVSGHISGPSFLFSSVRPSLPSRAPPGVLVSP